MSKKISELIELTAIATNDLFEVVDVSTSTSKKITWDNLIEDGFITNNKLAPGIIIPASYTQSAIGINTNSATYVDTGISSSFTTPLACTSILLTCEAHVSSDVGGVNYYLALTDNSNNVQIERSYAQPDSNAAHIGTIRLSIRLTVAANTAYIYKLRHKANGAFTGHLNEGALAISPTIMYAMMA